MDRLYGNSKELSTRESIVDPVNFIRVSEDSKENQKPKLFIGRNNTEIWAHQGSNVVFDCLVGKPDLEDQGPVSISVSFIILLLRNPLNYSDETLHAKKLCQ